MAVREKAGDGRQGSRPRLNTPEEWGKRARLPAPWQTAGWSQKGQKTRFRAVRDQLELMPEDALLDFGCGIGAFRQYLPPWVGYCGVDWAEPLLERARADSSRGYFFDELPYWHWQHVVAIGTFNLPGSLEDTQRWIWLLWERAHKTLVVSLYRGDDPRCISYDPADLAFPGAEVVEGYLDNDFLLVGRR